MVSDYDDYWPEEPTEQPRDVAIDEAIPRVLEIFQQSPEQVFYSTQIETRLEREVFHWITAKALAELGAGGKLQRMTIGVGGRDTNFYAHPKLRYWRREQKRLQGLIERIHDSKFTHAVGRHGELMLETALGRAGFMVQPMRDVRSWKGREWTETGHNLDRVAVRDGVEYGIEIKNTQGYIPRPELEIKLRMCEHLGLVPLFIMRFAPKTYINMIGGQAKGFALLFEHQIYPWGYEDLMAEVRQELGLKVHSPRDVPEEHMQRLLKGHEKILRRLQRQRAV